MDKLFRMLGDWKKPLISYFYAKPIEMRTSFFAMFRLPHPSGPTLSYWWDHEALDPQGSDHPHLDAAVSTCLSQTLGGRAALFWWDIRKDRLAPDEMTLSSCPQCRCGWEAAEPRSWQVQTLPGQVLSLTKMMLPHIGTGGQLGNRAAEGASRRDFKDKEEPAKLTEQARTDSCVKCRHREPEMF